MHLYVLTNQNNGKRYAGQTRQPLKTRIRQHRLIESKSAISGAIRKHGWDKFTVTSCRVNTQSELDELEEFVIQQVDSHVTKHGYNIKFGGNNHSGRFKPCDPETKKKISASNRGKTRTPEMIEKMRLRVIGNRHSDETKAKMSASRTGKKMPPRTDEWCKHQSEIRKGIPWSAARRAACNAWRVASLPA